MSSVAVTGGMSIWIPATVCAMNLMVRVTPVSSAAMSANVMGKNVMLALPVFLTGALSFINPDHVNLLFQDRMGQMMLGGAIVLQTVGYLWIRQVVKIEV